MILLRPTPDSRAAARVKDARATAISPTIITANKTSVKVNPFLFVIK